MTVSAEPMPDIHWEEAIRNWRALPEEERRRLHLAAIPRHVANSMAMAGEPVDEDWIRQRLARRIARRMPDPRRTVSNSPLSE